MKESSRVVLITGATSGIGRAIATLFDQQGCQVMATGRDVVALESVPATWRGVLDVTNEEQIRHVVQQVTEQFGRIDVLINNAGWGLRGAVEEIPVALFREQFQVNVEGPLQLIQAVVPVMRHRRGGTIINMSSVLGRMTMPYMGAYSASKYALEALSDALRVELLPFGIRVILIEPGLVQTHFDQNARLRSRAATEHVDSAYQQAYRRGDQAYARAARFAIAPERVAKTVWSAINSERPPARYVVPRSSTGFLWLLPLARRLGLEKWYARRGNPGHGPE